MTNQFPGATKMVLSPAAQAVLDAANNELDHAPWDVSYLAKPVVAAALRAAADQVISSVSPLCEDFDEYAQGFLAAHIQYRDEFLAIADELEAQP